MRAPGLTLDTGALIAFEKRKRDVMALLGHAWQTGIALHVPTVVVAEAWRGGSGSARLAKILAACRIEPLVEDVARLAGEALGVVRGATTIDAIVVACAHALGAPLVTSDPRDLRALADHFGGIPLIPI